MGGGKRKPIPNRHRSVRSFDDHHSLAERLRCSPSPHKSSASHPSSSIVSLLPPPPFLSKPADRVSAENSTLKSLSLEEQNEARRRKEGASINARSHRGSRDRWETREGGGRGARGGRAAHRRSICRGCQATNIHHQPTPSPSQPPPRASARRRLRSAGATCLASASRRHPRRPRPLPDSRAMHSTLAGPRLGAAAGPPPLRAVDAPLAPYRKSHASREPSSSSSSYSCSYSYSSASSSSCSAAAASPLPPAPPVRARLCCGRRGREHRHLGSLPAAILPLVRLAAQPRTTPNK